MRKRLISESHLHTLGGRLSRDGLYQLVPSLRSTSPPRLGGALGILPGSRYSPPGGWQRVSCITLKIDIFRDSQESAEALVLEGRGIYRLSPDEALEREEARLGQ